MPAKVTHKFNKAVEEKILTSPVGGVAKDLLKRGARVQSRARRNLSGVTGSGPRRINTGHLRASITVKLVVPPFVSELMVGQVTMPLLFAPLPLALIKVTFKGSVSLTAILDAVEGPRFVMVIV